MKISVVIPVFNDPRVVRAIESVLAQQHLGETELIVVDGASTDGRTIRALESYRDRLVFVSEPDNGLFDAINKGLRLTTGDVVGLLGSDDFLPDGQVFNEVIRAVANPNVDGCYGDMVFVDEKGATVRYWRAGRYAKWKVYCGWMPPHFSVFLKRPALQRCGEYATNYRIASDYDYMLRMFLDVNVQLAYVPRVILNMQAGGLSNGSWRNIVLANWEARRAWSRHRHSGGTIAALLKPLQKIPQLVMRPAAGRP